MIAGVLTNSQEATGGCATQGKNQGSSMVPPGLGDDGMGWDGDRMGHGKKARLSFVRTRWPASVSSTLRAPQLTTCDGDGVQESKN